MELRDKEIESVRFGIAQDDGEIAYKDGYHQPQNQRHQRSCGCRLTTGKGAYRDMVYEMPDGREVFFYHQSPVVVRKGDTYRLDSCGYQTSTTKERINRHTPSGIRVYQRDYVWYVSIDGKSEDKEFEDGMSITV